MIIEDDLDLCNFTKVSDNRGITSILESSQNSGKYDLDEKIIEFIKKTFNNKRISESSLFEGYIIKKNKPFKYKNFVTFCKGETMFSLGGGLFLELNIVEGFIYIPNPSKKMLQIAPFLCDSATFVEFGTKYILKRKFLNKIKFSNEINVNYISKRKKEYFYKV